MHFRECDYSTDEEDEDEKAKDKVAPTSKDTER